ncbi:hypothetical protein HZA97_08445 [Candidatus Woesearchaeota archaeon]|nr:hypothetical protein [Candidatus Woesearchaeota archaeon]
MGTNCVPVLDANMIQSTQPLEHRISVGSRVYHMTNEDNWERIQRDGFLKPCSVVKPPTYEYLIEDFYFGTFIVCGVNKNFDEWKEHLLFDYLKTYITKNRAKLVTLSFPLKNISGIYVREHAHFSPKIFLELCGQDLWSLVFGHDQLLEEDKRELFNSQRLLRDHSVVKLADYSGMYKVPELWYPHPVPVDKITVEGVLE